MVYQMRGGYSRFRSDVSQCRPYWRPLNRLYQSYRYHRYDPWYCDSKPYGRQRYNARNDSNGESYQMYRPRQSYKKFQPRKTTQYQTYKSPKVCSQCQSCQPSQPCKPCNMHNAYDSNSSQKKTRSLM